MLSRAAIMRAMADGYIRIDPFDQSKMGPNSVDLHLGDSLKRIDPRGAIPIRDPDTDEVVYAIDPTRPPGLVDVPVLSWSDVLSGDVSVHPKCWLLMPGQLYFAATAERTFCKGLVPQVMGRSTTGRLSISVHQTAGLGDNGFDGRWTLEISTLVPVLVWPGMRLLQVYFSPCYSSLGWRELRDALEADDLYGPGSHYQGSDDVRGPSPIKR